MSTLRRRTNSELEDRSETFTQFSGEGPNLIMSSRDRTKEFISILKSRERRDNGHSVPVKVKGRVIHQLYANFMEIARDISNQLSKTYEKLEKLTLLAKKRTLFEDKSREIEELSYIIKEDISFLNKEIAKLGAMSKTKQAFSGLHMQTHSNAVVVTLSSKLANMSSDFKSVLEVRTENLRFEKARKDRFSDLSVAALPATTAHGRSVLLENEYSENLSNGQVAINMSSPHTGYQNQMQLVNQEDSFIEDRAGAMMNIESTIVELGSIFQQLAHMVKTQEETIARIDSNVEEAQLNVESAHSELLRYFQSVTSNRSLMIKVFAILIFFFIIFVVFVA